jgi:D-sedoheptulose 7-phosphate isomerase
MYDEIRHYWREIGALTRQMPFSALADAAELLLDCQRCGGTIFVLGNGGSAATASHLACDLAKNVRVDGFAPFRVVALTDNAPMLTAWANDNGYDTVFAEQLAALVRPGDVVLAISASGESPNVLAAAELARAAGATTVALTGRSGGSLRALVDLAVLVPSDSIEQVEDAHMTIAHSLVVALRERMRQDAAALEQLKAEPVAIELGR